MHLSTEQMKGFDSFIDNEHNDEFQLEIDAPVLKKTNI